MIKKNSAVGSSKVFPPLGMRSQGESLRDWLALHEISPADALTLLDRAPRSPAVPVTPSAPAQMACPLTAQEVLQLGCDQLIAWCPPQAQAHLRAQLAQVRLILDPDQVRQITGGQRAQTLADMGDGRPVVLCPYRGEVAQALSLMHEMAHALQYRCCATPLLPPTVREMFALLGEAALVAALRPADPSLSTAFAAHFAARRHRFDSLYQPRLHQALSDLCAAPEDRPAAAYDYCWNYALAEVLTRAIIANTADEAACIWDLAQGNIHISDTMKKCIFYFEKQNIK